MIYLARHGQTAFNAEGRYQGAADSPLTTIGLGQAHRVGALLRTLTLECNTVILWSSPLGRALQTAAIVHSELQRQTNVVSDARLREVSFGSWNGLTAIDIEYLYPGACDGCNAFDWYFRSPDGESADEVERRLTSWLGDVASEGKCHIVISHALTGRLLRGLYTGMPRSEALMLEVPQSAVFRLNAGRIERFDAP
jgi:broad specificity phosphatase PhoE